MKISLPPVLNAPPSAVIFDLDGTLLDTEPLYTQASQLVIDPFGKTFDLSLKKKIMGGDSRVSAATVIDHLSLPLSVDEYLGQRETHLIPLFMAAPEIKGAGLFVESLHKKGISQGIATSSHKNLCDIKLKERDWVKCIETTVCGDHPHVENAKPAPDIFLICAQQLGVSPEQCLAFEDSPKGITAALSAGMRVIAINSPYVEMSDLSDACLIIEDFNQLAGLLKIW